MKTQTSGLDGGTILALLLLGSQPGVGEQRDRSGVGPLAPGHLPQQPLEVGELVGAMHSGRREHARQCRRPRHRHVAAEEQPQLPAPVKLNGQCRGELPARAAA